MKRRKGEITKTLMDLKACEMVPRKRPTRSLNVGRKWIECEHMNKQIWSNTYWSKRNRMSEIQRGDR